MMNNYSVEGEHSPSKNRMIAQDYPPPVPTGLGPEYAGLWYAAHRLSDEIDDPANGTIEARRARLPELERLQALMAVFWNRHRIQGEKKHAATSGMPPEPPLPDFDNWQPPEMWQEEKR